MFRAVIWLIVIVAVVSFGATVVFGKPAETRNQTCTITARDSATLTVECINETGAKSVSVKDVPSDLYPLCQVSSRWEECKIR